MKVQPTPLKSHLAKAGKIISWISFRVFLSLAILYLVFEANFEPIRAVYEKY